LKCSFLEIYNEQIYDLMEPSTMTLHLRENMKKGVFVDRLTEVSVTSALEAYAVRYGSRRLRYVRCQTQNFN
jgi:kinesin family protein 15